MGKPGSVTVAAVSFLLFALGNWSEAKEADGKTLFENTCGRCHTIERPKSKQKTREEWQITVSRMRKNGARLTDEGAKLIVDHLAETYKR